jgi:hypothetical protein
MILILLSVLVPRMLFGYRAAIPDHTGIAVLAKLEEEEQQSKCCFASRSLQTVKDLAK